MREHKKPMLTFRDGLEVNRIIDKAYASSRSGKWESLDDCR